MRTVLAMVFALMLSISLNVSGAQAADKNPIFGGAKVTTMSKADNTKVTGKGQYANYYGYYGVLYASYAYYYGDYALYTAPANSSSEYNNYYNAYLYSYAAADNYYYAYLYSYYGY